MDHDEICPEIIFGREEWSPNWVTSPSGQQTKEYAISLNMAKELPLMFSY
ncbi:MAG: antA/AntB antirepressor family protein [Oligoflexia bacterium]|nr:antA/AntB antirepressor family protein [Oligoflexia bacterium]